MEQDLSRMRESLLVSERSGRVMREALGALDSVSGPKQGCGVVEVSRKCAQTGWH